MKNVSGLILLAVLSLVWRSHGANLGEAACALACPEGEHVVGCQCVGGNDTIECPLRKCVASDPPCLEYKRDKYRCRTCECLYACPDRKCSNCSFGVEEFYDDFGCLSCRCRQPPHCQNTTCTKYCAEGYEKDNNGCDDCSCKLCGNFCKIGCLFGKLVDFNGCLLCECKTKPTCGPVLNNSCLRGRLLDEDGCPTSQCQEECPPVCAIFCPYGNVKDGNGCDTCTCKERPKCPPVCAIFCPYGNVKDINGCDTCTCKGRPKCPPAYKIRCPYGRVLDANGCVICKPRPGCRSGCGNY